jgi:hypothetical protein
MFINRSALTDPDAAARGYHKSKSESFGLLYDPGLFWASRTFEARPYETFTVHFNSPVEIRYLTKDNRLVSPIGDNFQTVLLTNVTKEPVTVEKGTILERLTESLEFDVKFNLTSAVYRHQYVLDWFSSEVFPEKNSFA